MSDSVLDTYAIIHRNASKLSAYVADKIVGDIARLGWPVGEVIGSETELIERYQVSRAVFREAVRLVEHLQVARMRRGPGGGLMVLEPSMDSTTDALSVYLLYIGAGLGEVFEARRALEETAAEQATERIDEQGIATLRALVADEAAGETTDPRKLHRVVASMTANPALAFFVELLNEISTLYLPQVTELTPETYGESAHAHSKIVEAIISGDASLARHRMGKHLDGEAQYLMSRGHQGHGDVARLQDSLGSRGKLAEQLAGILVRDIVQDGWVVGTLFGRESELQERYGVSRAVLREAVRVLEHHQVVRMRRGPGGGLFVVEPGIAALVDAVTLQIQRIGIAPVHLFEVRTAVEMTVLDLAIARLDMGVVDRLLEALENEKAAASLRDLPIAAHNLHGVLAHASGNRVLELLVLVLVRVSRARASKPNGAADPAPLDVYITHKSITEAVVSGDAELARYRMRKHLGVLVEWSR